MPTIERRLTMLLLLCAAAATACEIDDDDDDDAGDDAGELDAAVDASRDSARPDATDDDDDASTEDDASSEDAGDPAVFRPEQRPFSEARLAQLQLPPGFGIEVFAADLGNPRMLAVADDGDVYVTRRDQGEVTRLRDADGDGRAEERATVVSGVEGVHGIALHEDALYLASVREVLRAPRMPDGSIGTPTVIIDDLPDGGQHPNRTLAFGPDGMLYITVGSTCDACDETNPESATILRASADGSSRTVYARGLRNTLGFGWHPDTGQLWGSDHGSDWRGNDQPPDELNRLEQGNDYGWPYCFGAMQIDPVIDEPPMGTKESYCAATVGSRLDYPAHSAPIGFAFYTADRFPSEYESDAFVAFRGSWNRYPATGYKIVRVRFNGEGQPVDIEDFVSGFLIEDGRAHFGRLAGVAVAADGALLFTDDTNGIVYRVDYEGAGDEDAG